MTVGVTKITTVRLSCAMCDASVDLDTASRREASRAAESAHGWVTIRNDSSELCYVCPAHQLPCPHCERPMPAALNIASRVRIRDRVAARIAESREARRG